MESLYIHIPFCDAICHYCDFPKRIATQELKIKYIDNLIKEYYLYDIPSLKTIYIGGGTPSSLSLDLLVSLLEILPNAEELTIECNPNDITTELLNVLKENGITRISLGIQTFSDKLLKGIGRVHTSEEAKMAIKLIKEFDFDLSVDMIFNLPNQTLDDLYRDLELVKGIDHVSYYSLILEPNTVFEKLINKGKLIEPENGDEFFEVVINKMNEYGYNHYEISNFALTHRSKHNLTYWNNQEYIGIGLAASGYINGERYSNVRMFEEYFKLIDISKKPIHYVEKLSKKDKMYEHLMLGFRKLEGIDIEEFARLYNISIFKAFSELEKLVSEDYLEIENGKIKVTKKGLFYNNDLLVRLL